MKSMNVSTTTASRVSKLRIFNPILRRITVFLFTVVILFPAFSQEKVDFIVLLDTSKGMFDSFEESIELLVEEVLKKQLTAEDTFHLLSFEAVPEFEIQRTLSNETAIKEALSRLLLLQPLGNYCDLVAGLKYTGEYVNELSLTTKKKILLLTQGSHVPPPESPYQDEEENLERIESLTSFMQRNGWDMNIVRFSEGALEEEEPVLLQKLSEDMKSPIVQAGSDAVDTTLAATGAIRVLFPQEPVSSKKNPAVPLTFENHSNEARNLVIDSAVSDGNEYIAEELKVSLAVGETKSGKLMLTLPSSLQPGTHRIELVLHAVQGGPIYPNSGTVTIEIAETGLVGGIGENGTYILYGIIFIVLIIALFILIRRLFAGSSDDSDKKRVSTGIDGPGSVDRDRGGSGIRLKGRDQSDAAAAGDALGAYAGDSSSSFTQMGSTEKSGSDAAALLSGSKERRGRSGEDASSLLSAASSSERERESTASFLASVKRESESSLDVLGTGREKESSDRAEALANFRRNVGGLSSDEAASRISAFKKGAGGSAARSRAASLGFSGDAYRKRKSAGELPVELRVDFQHPSMTKNLDWFKDGDEKSIGGVGSGADFIVSTIPIEGIIAKVKRKGEQFLLEPECRECFPEFHQKGNENILGVRIKVRSPETERLTNFSLREWAPTKDRLNRYLHKVDEPGLPKEDFDPDDF